MSISVNDEYREEKECVYKGRRYIVRDNGAVGHGMPEAARWRNAAMGCVTAEEVLAVAAEVRAHVR